MPAEVDVLRDLLVAAEVQSRHDTRWSALKLVLHRWFEGSYDPAGATTASATYPIELGPFTSHDHRVRNTRPSSCNPVSAW